MLIIWVIDRCTSNAPFVGKNTDTFAISLSSSQIPDFSRRFSIIVVLLRNTIFNLLLAII